MARDEEQREALRWQALADSLAEMSPQDAVAELRGLGEDPKGLADNALAALRSGLQQAADASAIHSSEESRSDPMRTVTVESPAASSEASSSGVDTAATTLLDKARTEHRREAARIRDLQVRLPATAAARRRLLELLFGRAPELLQAALTVQFRDFSGLSDQEVSSALSQLAALGVLDDAGLGQGLEAAELDEGGGEDPDPAS